MFVFQTEIVGLSNPLPQSFRKGIATGTECLTLPEPPPEEDKPDPELFEVLAQGSEVVSKYEFANEGILLLGNTGAGKTTVTQIIAGNLSRLHAVFTNEFQEDLIIIDEDDRIGLPTTQSKTLVPELVVKSDQENNFTKTHFYDNPGFDDTRGAVMDVCANYFVNQVTTTKLSSVKLLFLVLHSSVKSGNDRIDFDLLATHAATFVKDLAKFKKSIALVVTKVSNFNGIGQNVSDASVLNGVGGFLKTYNNTLYSKLTGDPQADALILNKIVFVETLLETDMITGNFTKIWFVKSPIECGPLGEQTMYLDARSNITELYNSLQYTKINVLNDFGYTVKPETKTMVQNYTRDVINVEITHALKPIFLNFEDRYKRSLESNVVLDALNITQSLYLMQRTQLLLNNFNNQISNATTPSATFYSQALKIFFEGSGYTLAGGFQNFMEQQEELISFFEMITEAQLSRNNDTWSIPLTSFEAKLSEDHKWLTFCETLDHTVRSHEFHINRTGFTEKLDNETWLDFIIKNNVIKGDYADEIKRISTRVSIQMLAIVDFLMNYSMGKMTCKCMDTNISLCYQNFMRIGDAFPEIQSVCGSRSNQVQFLAAHTIFLNAPSPSFIEQDAIIMTPNLINPTENPWEMNLISRNADPWSPSTAANGAGGTGGSGSHGCMGKPGNPTGSFLGVIDTVSKFTPNSGIAFYTRGGDGGPGQHGGAGGSGTFRHADLQRDLPDHVFLGAVKEHWGITGGEGGSGGDGGYGGTSGFGNFLEKFVFQNSSSIVSERMDGSRGPGGNGGSGGEGGKAGNGYKCLLQGNTYNCITPAPGPSHGRHDGSRGSSGSFGSQVSCPLAQPTRDIILKSSKHLDYKKLFKSELHPTTTSFITKMDTSSLTKSHFTIESLVEEILYLESLRIDTVQMPSGRLRNIYLDFLQKVGQFEADHFAGAEQKHKKLIDMLLSTSYNSLVTLLSKSNLYMHVDINQYFEINKQQIQSIGAPSTLLPRAIDASKKMFETDLYNKIDQSSAIIDDIVKPVLLEISDVLSKSLVEFYTFFAGLILDETLSLGERHLALENNEQKHKQLILFETFNMTCSIANSFGNNISFSGFLSVVEGLRQNLSGKPEEILRLEDLVNEAEKFVLDTKQKKKIVAEYISFTQLLWNYLLQAKADIGNNVEIGRFQPQIPKPTVISKLRQFKALLDQFSDAAMVLPLMTTTLDRIHDALTHIISIYIDIQDYHAIQMLSKHINRSSNNNAPIPDQDIQKYLSIYNETIRKNLMDQEVNKAMHMLRHWTFPFASFYDLPTLPASSLVLEAENEQLQQVNQIISHLERYKQGAVTLFDNLVIQTNFTSGYASSSPFFVWEHKDWQDSIRDLLSGRKVRIEANVHKQGFEGWEAIKFKMLELNLKLVNPFPDERQSEFGELQREFDELQICFGVTMTHSGISHYRFQRNFYVTTNTNQTLIYNFERDTNGNRMGTNYAYEKFKKEECHLSPFTVWTIQLHNVARQNTKCGTENIGFKNFDKFLPFVNLELVGTGTYVRAEQALAASRGNMHLDSFYERDERYRFDEIQQTGSFDAK